MEMNANMNEPSVETLRMRARARHSPVGKPSNTEPNDAVIGKKCPQQVEAEEEIGRRPRNESVEFWSAAADFWRR